MAYKSLQSIESALTAEGVECEPDMVTWRKVVLKQNPLKWTWLLPYKWIKKTFASSDNFFVINVEGVLSVLGILAWLAVNYFVAIYYFTDASIVVAAMALISTLVITGIAIGLACEYVQRSLYTNVYLARRNYNYEREITRHEREYEKYPQDIVEKYDRAISALEQRGLHFQENACTQKGSDFECGIVKAAGHFFIMIQELSDQDMYGKTHGNRLCVGYAEDNGR